MKNFKKAQVIMLPTKEKSHIHKQLEGNLSFYENPIEGRNFTSTYHLYIISEDKTEDGDWCLDTKNNILFISDGKLNLHTFTDKKIITTTDTSLNEKDRFNGKSWESLLPQPSQQFIKHYIEVYNKREIIKDVFVEYELDKVNSILYQGECGICDDSCNIVFKVKVNPDNTINIKLYKESWNREEVIEFGNKIREYCKDGWKQDSLHRVFFEWDKYVNENLQ